MDYKGYKIQNDGSYNMYTIKPNGKGSVPKELRGRYTDYGSAQKAIDAYAKVKGKGQPNGETDNQS